MKRLQLFATMALLGMLNGSLAVMEVRADSSAAATHKAASITMFLVAIGDGNGGHRFGCGDSLVAVRIPAPPTMAPLSAALRTLLANHERYYGQSGLYNALYRARLTLRRAVIRNGRAIIHLSGRLNLGGECDNPRVEAQLKRTVLQFPSVHGAYIYVNNVPLRKLLSLK